MGSEGMSNGDGFARGWYCRECGGLLQGKAPGHTRLCVECHDDLIMEPGAVARWETPPANLLELEAWGEGEAA